VRARRSRSFDPVQTMSDFRDSVTSIAVRGHQLCAASVDGYIRTFDVRAGEARPCPDRQAFARPRCSPLRK
jgi:hypothetical protein